MANNNPVDNLSKNHITDKRNELIWALSLQNYTLGQIGIIFNINRSTVMRIVRKMPRGWQTRWVNKDKL